MQTHPSRPCFGLFGVFTLSLICLVVLGPFTTENQWVFSGKEGGLKSCIGEGHPSPLCPSFVFVFGLKGNMHACLFLAPFQNFLDVLEHVTSLSNDGFVVLSMLCILAL